jgi:hypothetical protein
VFLDQPECVEGVLGFDAIDYQCLWLLQFVAQETRLPSVTQETSHCFGPHVGVLEYRQAVTDM